MANQMPPICSCWHSTDESTVHIPLTKSIGQYQPGSFFGYTFARARPEVHLFTPVFMAIAQSLSALTWQGRKSIQLCHSSRQAKGIGNVPVHWATQWVPQCWDSDERESWIVGSLAREALFYGFRVKLMSWAAVANSPAHWSRGCLRCWFQRLNSSSSLYKLVASSRQFPESWWGPLSQSTLSSTTWHW